MFKKKFSVFTIIFILLIFSLAYSSVFADGYSTSSSEALPSATPTINRRDELEISDKAFFDVNNLTLEHEIDPECVDQFPISPDSYGSATMCVTFDDWVYGDKDNPIMLNGGYEMMRGIEGWYEQDGQLIAIIIPLATANKEKNEAQLNGYLVQEFFEFFYDGDESFWEKKMGFGPGDTININIALPSVAWAGNSTQGFGFEATAYTQEDIDLFFATGDASSAFGNILWPVVDIEKRW